MPKHFLNNSKTTLKSLENNFFDPQNYQNTVVNMAKSVDFLELFQSTSPIFGLLALKKKSFSLTAKDIKKKTEKR